MTGTATTSGLLELGDLRMYHEETGEGSPLVLVHGGMLDIEQAWRPMIPALAQRHRVVALELQGHGRTNDVDRPISPSTAAGDVVALLDHLGVDRAHVMGHSLGAAVALELAVSHGDRVRSVVALSASVRPDGMHEDFSDPERMASSTRMPTQEDFVAMRDSYRRLSPHPEHFEDFLQSLSANQADLRGWSDEQLAGITAPVLFVLGDHDFTTIAHADLMLRLVPGSQLAVLPGTTHMQVTRRTELLELLTRDVLD